MTNKDINYRELSDELDAILEELSSGDLDIDEALKKHSRAMEILELLESHLKTAENKVKKVKTGK